jgi:diguanylate cyclase
MLFRRSQPEMKAASIAPTANEADKALDTVAAFLRAYGQHAFDTDEFEARELQAQCEVWASRIVMGPVQDVGTESPKSSDGVKRDWGGVRSFLREHRQIEGDYVSRSMGNLRHAIRTFAQCLSTAVAQDKQSDAAVEDSLGALINALGDTDTERVRREATLVVRTVRSAIKARRDREKKQLEVLGERLRTLRSELTEAKTQASLDPLTQLSNRAAFDEHLDRLSDLGLLFGHPPCLVMLDIDHFKSINDSFGHPAGDAVIKESAECLVRAFLRKQDFVARYGGEEFAVLLVDTHSSGAVMLAERARGLVKERLISHHGRQISVTLSAGVAALVPGEGALSWLERADKALYSAKQQGRDRVVLAPVVDES